MTDVQRELVEFEKIVFDELLTKGYPKESIILEGKLDARRFVDFLITDVDTGLPVMMIEIKTCGNRTEEAILSMAFNSLKACYAQNNPPLKQLLLFFPS